MHGGEGGARMLALCSQAYSYKVDRPGIVPYIRLYQLQANTATQSDYRYAITSHKIQCKPMTLQISHLAGLWLHALKWHCLVAALQYRIDLHCVR